MTKSKGSPRHSIDAKKDRLPRESTASTKKLRSPELEKLRSAIHDLRKRLKGEAEKHESDEGAVVDAGNVRKRAVEQINALKKRGAEMTKQLKKGRKDTDQRERARRKALAKIAELRADPTRRE